MTTLVVTLVVFGLLIMLAALLAGRS